MIVKLKPEITESVSEAEMSSTEFYSLNCRGRLLSLESPVIMGILNVTPDSFSDGGSYQEVEAAVEQARVMLSQGATIIDVGGYSSRPGADHISTAEERNRVLPVIRALRDQFPQALLSIDSFRSAVASAALEAGAHLVNDISGGDLDPHMMPMVAEWGDVPYIMMHMKGTPQNMQRQARYEHVVNAVWQYFVEKTLQLRKLGLSDVVLDPGFGFGKTIRHNYQLMASLKQFSMFGYPMLVGVSRKSFIYKVTGNEPATADMHSQILHDHCLRQGANILRVHHVESAAKTIRLYLRMRADGIV